MPFDGESRGELELSGSFVTPGYLDDPAANVEAFDGEWLRTGDVAVIDKQWNITIVDRKKDIIVSGGINIAPTEVEQAIGRHPEVVAVGVCAVSDRVLGESVHAAVVLAPGSALTEQDVVAWCAQHLASVKKPRSVEFVDELPISSTGKLLRRELRRDPSTWATTHRAARTSTILRHRSRGDIDSLRPSGAPGRSPGPATLSSRGHGQLNLHNDGFGGHRGLAWHGTWIHGVRRSTTPSRPVASGGRGSTAPRVRVRWRPSAIWCGSTRSS